MKDTRALTQYQAALQQAYTSSLQALEAIDEAPVGTPHTYAELKSGWAQQLSQSGLPPEQVIREMAEAALPGLNMNQSGRFFAWVIGGSHPAALGADWLTSVWDQNGGVYATSPSAAIAEEIAGEWLKDLLRLPATASFALVTGCQMANFTGLAAGRNALFRQAGWDIEKRGFYGAPRVRVVTSEYKHSTVVRALRMLGFGSELTIEVATDDRGCIVPEALEQVLAAEPKVPALIILQAGEIHTGHFDDFRTLLPMIRKYPAWVHVDGAFGLWAAASPAHAHLVKGIEGADSWSTDGHKWLNVPYDCGYAFVAQPDAHLGAFSEYAAYVREDTTGRDAYRWNPEFSRRARGFATYAAIRELGRDGIVDLVARNCRHAARIVEGAAHFPGVEVLSPPVINQGLLAFHSPDGHSSPDDQGAFTDRVIQAINATGEAFFQPSVFKGRRCMRISVSGWRTSDEDVHRTVAAIGEAIRQVTSAG